jgi:hypothetical protein
MSKRPSGSGTAKNGLDSTKMKAFMLEWISQRTMTAPGFVNVWWALLPWA